MDYDTIQQRADDLYLMFQRKYKIEPDELDEYTKLIEDMVLIQQNPT